MAKRIDHRQRIEALESALKDALKEHDAELAQRAAAQLAQYRPGKLLQTRNTSRLDRSV